MPGPVGLVPQVHPMNGGAGVRFLIAGRGVRINVRSAEGRRTGVCVDCIKAEWFDL